MKKYIPFIIIVLVIATSVSASVRIRSRVSIRAAGVSGGAATVVGHVASGAGSCTGTTIRGNNQAPGCSGTSQTTFTYTPTTAGNGVLIAISCGSGATVPTAVTLTASGWVLTKVIDVVGTTSS